MKLLETRRTRPIIPPPRPVVSEIPAAELDTGEAPPPRRERAAVQPVADLPASPPEAAKVEVVAVVQVAVVEVTVIADSAGDVKSASAEPAVDDFGSGVGEE